jgi:hypothetical protein
MKKILFIVILIVNITICYSSNVAIYLWGQSNMCGKCSLRAATSEAIIPHYIINIDSNITSTYKYQVQAILTTIALRPNNYIISSDAYPCADGSHLSCVDYYDFGIKISRFIFPNITYNVLK